MVEAAFELVRATAGLRLRDRRRTVALLGTARDDDRDDPVGPKQASEAALIGRAVTRVSNRLPGRPTCLPQALATQRMLRRRRIPNRLHLGVANRGDPTAHAWVTVEGRPVVGEGGIEGLAPLASFV